MPYQTHSNKQYLLPIALLFAVIMLLLATAVFVLTPKIQNNLAQQIQEELTKHSIAAKITLSGRDVTLTGMVDDVETKQKAESITKKICGIRFIENQLLTEKAENLALLNTHQKAEVEQSTETKLEPAISTNSNLDPEKPSESVVVVKDIPSPSQTKESSSKGEETPKTVEETEERSTQATTKQIVEEDTSSPKRKVLNYETMLAAMNAYKKQKGRNPKRLNTATIRFKKDTAEMLPATQTELNNWISHFHKNKAPIEITVTAKTESLALNRAQAIRTYFINQNIEKGRIKSFGKSGEETVSIEAVK